MGPMSYATPGTARKGIIAAGPLQQWQRSLPGSGKTVIQQGNHRLVAAFIAGCAQNDTNQADLPLLG